MLKNRYMIILLVFAFVLFAGCSNTSNNKDEQGINGNNQEVENEEKENDEEDHENNEVEDNHSNSEENDTDEEEIVEATYRLNSETWGIEPIDNANEQVVLLTIDDAPDKYALEMAETLEKLDVNAIFFVNGHFLETEEEKETLKAIYDKGFLIGNHTYSHENLQNISEEEQREEIITVNNMVEEIIGERPKFFRAPHGVNTDFSRALAKEEGMVLMNWTYGYDYFEPYMDKDKITEAMITGEGPEVDVDYSLLKSGANLLMHDREWTAAALHDIVIGLQDKGYEMVDPKLIQTIESES